MGIGVLLALRTEGGVATLDSDRPDHHHPADFKTYDISPTVAYKNGPLRIGVGIQIGPVDGRSCRRTSARSALRTTTSAPTSAPAPGAGAATSASSTRRSRRCCSSARSTGAGEASTSTGTPPSPTCRRSTRTTLVNQPVSTKLHPPHTRRVRHRVAPDARAGPGRGLHLLQLAAVPGHRHHASRTPPSTPTRPKQWQPHLELPDRGRVHAERARPAAGRAPLRPDARAPPTPCFRTFPTRTVSTSRSAVPTAGARSASTRGYQYIMFFEQTSTDPYFPASYNVGRVRAEPRPSASRSRSDEFRRAPGVLEGEP